MWMFIAQTKACHITFAVNAKNLAIRSLVDMTMESIAMTPEAKLKLKTLLVKHESFKAFPYTDTTGHLSIGIGRNLSDRGISLSEAYVLLDDDISYFSNKLNFYLPVMRDLCENRQIALIDMCFSLGVQGFLNFANMIAALNAGDYYLAANEILDSKWAQQCPHRVVALANIVRTGEI